MTKRTSLKLDDQRQRRLEQVQNIISNGEHDDPPMSDAIDAAFIHLIQSKENIDAAREKYDPRVIQDIANTDVLRFHYRTSIDQNYR